MQCYIGLNPNRTADVAADSANSIGDLIDMNTAPTNAALANGTARSMFEALGATGTPAPNMYPAITLAESVRLEQGVNTFKAVVTGGVTSGASPHISVGVVITPVS